MASVNSLRCFILCLCVFLHGTADAYDIGKDMKRNACQLAVSRGFKCEEHEVETQDGYILTLHRLPLQVNKTNCAKSDKVILLNHGFLGSSTNFLVNDANESLGYLFNDACYDVWLANARGNFYSLKHNTFTSDDEEFWQFSFDEMAQYDIPAMIEFILQKTNQKSLYYLGHSQGTISGFEAFSENKELAKKVRLFVGLGPVGYAAHVQTKAKMYKVMSDKMIYRILGHKALYPHDWKRELAIKTTCNNRFTRGICVKFGEALAGKFSNHFIKERIPVYFMHTPAGSSVQTLVHWAQLMRGNTTRKYSHYDPVVNQAKYGSDQPPAIDFTKMDVPVVLFSGRNDIVATEEDVKRLVSELPHVTAHIRISDYSHFDFLWATNTATTIFEPLKYFMGNY